MGTCIFDFMVVQVMGIQYQARVISRCFSTPLLFFIRKHELPDECEQTYLVNKLNCPSESGFFLWKTIRTSAGSK